jgi:flotillin
VLDSILGMAVQMPALKKLGEELGVSLEGGLAQVTNEAMNATPKPVPEVLTDEVDAVVKPAAE